MSLVATEYFIPPNFDSLVEEVLSTLTEDETKIAHLKKEFYILFGEHAEKLAHYDTNLSLLRDEKYALGKAPTKESIKGIEDKISAAKTPQAAAAMTQKIDKLNADLKAHATVDVKIHEMQKERDEFWETTGLAELFSMCNKATTAPPRDGKEYEEKVQSILEEMFPDNVTERSAKVVPYNKFVDGVSIKSTLPDFSRNKAELDFVVYSADDEIASLWEIKLHSSAIFGDSIKLLRMRDYCIAVQVHTPHCVSLKALPEEREKKNRLFRLFGEDVISYVCMKPPEGDFLSSSQTFRTHVIDVLGRVLAESGDSSPGEVTAKLLEDEPLYEKVIPFLKNVSIFTTK